MRKKRKLRARSEAEVEHATDMETPELIEALEAAEAAKDLPEAEESLEEQEERRRKLSKILESLLFASDKPLTVPRFKQLTGEKDLDRIKEALEQLARDYEGRGIVLHDVAGGWQFRTAPDTAEWVQQLVAGRPVRLTRAQLETLAIIAYRQPITRPEIDEIRGVDSGGTLKLLLDRSLVRVLGKKEEPGRPILYGTTKEFLEFFNLAALKDLPTLREYHELTEDSMRTVEEKLGVTAEEAQETARAQRQAAEEAAAAKAAAESAAEQAMAAAEEAGDAEQADGESEPEVEAPATNGESEVEAEPEADDGDLEASEGEGESEVEAAADEPSAVDAPPPPPDETADEPSPSQSV